MMKQFPFVWFNRAVNAKISQERSTHLSSSRSPPFFPFFFPIPPSIICARFWWWRSEVERKKEKLFVIVRLQTFFLKFTPKMSQYPRSLFTRPFLLPSLCFFFFRDNRCNPVAKKGLPSFFWLSGSNISKRYWGSEWKSDKGGSIFSWTAEKGNLRRKGSERGLFSSIKARNSSWRLSFNTACFFHLYTDRILGQRDTRVT